MALVPARTVTDRYCADLLGMYRNFTPKFAKKFADIGDIATQGMIDYVKEVKDGVFPAPEHKYKLSGGAAEFEKLFDEMSPLFE